MSLFDGVSYVDHQIVEPLSVSSNTHRDLESYFLAVLFFARGECDVSLANEGAVVVPELERVPQVYGGGNVWQVFVLFSCWALSQKSE